MAFICQKHGLNRVPRYWYLVPFMKHNSNISSNSLVGAAGIKGLNG